MSKLKKKDINELARIRQDSGMYEMYFDKVYDIMYKRLRKIDPEFSSSLIKVIADHRAVTDIEEGY